MENLRLEKCTASSAKVEKIYQDEGAKDLALATEAQTVLKFLLCIPTRI